MYKYIFIFFFIFSFPSLAQQKSTADSSVSKIILTGTYTGRNVFFQNPLADVTQQIYCTDSVVVNGKRCIVNLNQSAYEINLDSVVNVLGTPVTIFIYHKKNCRPKALISMSFPQPRSKVEFISFTIADTTGRIHLTTTNTPTENRPPFQLEQQRGNQWNVIMVIPQKWNLKNTYDTVVPLTPGMNTFRLSEMQYASSGIVVTVRSGIPETTCSIDASMNCITFNNMAYYDIQTAEGISLEKGYKNKIDISYFTNGSYVLFYENQRLQFDIKRSKNKKRT